MLVGAVLAATSATAIAANQDYNYAIQATTSVGAPSYLSGDFGSMKADQAISTLKNILSAEPSYKATGREEFKVRSQYVDNNGIRTSRLTQTIDGLPVYGTEMVIREKLDVQNPQLQLGNSFTNNVEGKIFSVTGHVAKVSTNSAKLGVMTSARAKNNVLRAAQNLGSVVGEPELAYYYSSETGQAVQAWKIEVSYSNETMAWGRDIIFFDAGSADVLSRWPQVHSAKSRSTHSLDNQTVESQADEHKLPGRLLCTDNQACNDAQGQQAHDGASDVYDYLKNQFGMDSFDNRGSKIISSVHLGNGVNNAFWTGKQMIYGDGDGTRFNAFTNDYDVIAHELGHGVTTSFSNLTYRNGSGALNESFSDIMGMNADARKRGLSVPNWKLGEEIRKDGQPFRHMDNPTADGVSKDYFPEKFAYIQSWEQCNQQNDCGGVHLNSGISNLAYVLTVQGGSHPRGKTSQQVEGIGLDKAEQIFFYSYKDGLQANATFADARQATIDYAQQTYGDAEANTLKNAWCAVGVGECGDDGTGPVEPGDGLENGKGVSVSGSQGESQYFTMDVPANATNLSFSITGGSGDADLYVKAGSKPTTSSYDCRPYKDGNEEVCNITNAQAGTYHVMLNGYSNYANVTLTGRYDGDSTTPGENEAPVARFNVDCDGLSCTFDASGSTDSDGSITSYEWSIGGMPATGVNYQYTFAEGGDYEVKLTVTDNDDAEASTTQTVSVSSGTTNPGNCQGVSQWELWTTYYPGQQVQYQGKLYQANYTVYYWAPDSGYGYWTLVGNC